VVVERGVKASAEGAQKLVTPAGFEPATSGLGNRCSIQLSYGATMKTVSQRKQLCSLIFASDRGRLRYRAAW
jgi:hypothetical protein